MKREQENSTADRAAATQILTVAPAVLALPREDAEQLRKLLRDICGVAGVESASEEALDACGRYAARALALVNRHAEPSEAAPADERKAS